MLISEFLPNPVGKDAGSEWVELVNNTTEPVRLDGWFLEIGARRKVKLKSEIAPREYLVVQGREGSTLGLRNTDGVLSLYDPEGRLVDSAQFRGTAPEGKSFARQGDSRFTPYKSQGFSLGFIWSEPTPGTANQGTPRGLSYPRFLSTQYTTLSANRHH